MLSKVSELKTKCVNIRKDQTEWCARNDINFSKFVRRLIDEEIKCRNLGPEDVQLNGDDIIFKYVRGLIIDMVHKDSPNRTDFAYLNTDYVKTVIDLVIPCLDDHYALLTDEEKDLLRNSDYDQSKDEPSDIIGSLYSEEENNMIAFCIVLKSKLGYDDIGQISPLIDSGVIKIIDTTKPWISPAGEQPKGL